MIEESASARINQAAKRGRVGALRSGLSSYQRPHKRKRVNLSPHFKNVLSFKSLSGRDGENDSPLPHLNNLVRNPLLGKRGADALRRSESRREDEASCETGSPCGQKIYTHPDTQKQQDRHGLILRKMYRICKK